MAEKDKELLLKDLCTRLPYRVICLLYANGTSITEELKIGGLEQFILGSLEVKPYLRPMSSMTEDEFLEYHNIKYYKLAYRDGWKRIDVGKFHDIGIIPIEDYLDWLNVHHFDYRGLIEKGLAIEASEGMYDINEK